MLNPTIDIEYNSTMTIFCLNSVVFPENWDHSINSLYTNQKEPSSDDSIYILSLYSCVWTTGCCPDEFRLRIKRTILPTVDESHTKNVAGFTCSERPARSIPPTYPGDFDNLFFP
jgi:hypothetical protein